jgi:hypothetical protein
MAPLDVCSVVSGVRADVHLTPKADIKADEIDVHFVPIATKVQRTKWG